MLSLIKSIVKKSPTLVALERKRQWRAHILKDWWGTKVWRQTREVVTPLGFKLRSGLHPAYEQMRNGTFEPDETRVLIEQFNQTDRFIDIGANLGYYTCLALQNARPVVAFEPQPQNLACLFSNLIVNRWEDKAEVFPIALSEHSGLLTLFGASGPSASLLPNWAGYSSRHQQTVPVSTLDKILGGRFANERLLIKMDVEGAEYQVLKGCTATLGRTPKPVWLIEVCLQEFHPDGANPDYPKIFELFWNHGYEAFTANEERRLVTPQDVEKWVTARSSESGTFNYIFTA